jgi:hypothetical protein
MQRTHFMVIFGITCLSACYRLDTGTIVPRINRFEIAETPIMAHGWHRLFIVMFYLFRMSLSEVEADHGRDPEGSCFFCNFIKNRIYVL